MTDMTKQTEAISTERALKLALEAQIHKAGMNPVMQGECYLMHPEALQKLIEVAIREARASEAKEQPAPATELREQEPEYTWPTVAEYECDVGFKTNDAFRMGWDMARTTNKMLGITSPQAQPAQQEPVSDRENAIIRFALHQFMSNAYSHMNAAAQDKDSRYYTVGAVEKCAKDAKEAEALLSRLQFKAPKPAQRTWVGLTEEETGHWAADFLDGAKWAEAKLREKNGITKEQT